MNHYFNAFRNQKRLDWVFQIPPWRDLAPGSTALFPTIGVLHAPPLPPMAVKSKPPALRVVVDSGDMINTENQGVLDTRVKDISDPRKFPRVTYVGPVFFRSDKQKFKKGLIINISRSGVFIETKNKYFLGQVIELVIPNKKIDKRLRIKGWIVRLNQTGIGVTFKGTLERRSGKERRSDLDRRSGSDRRNHRRQRARA